MTRSRLFALIEAFESDMRSLVNRYILDHADERDVLAGDYEGANARRANDGANSLASIADYLDLRPCYDVLNRFRGDLPQALAHEVKSNTVELDRLVPIRNRVMHGRPLRPDDPEIALSALNHYKSRFWPTTVSVLSRLNSDVLWEPLVNQGPDRSDRVLHNLPLADYDETGLLGRDSDIDALTRMLKRRRDPVVTITGEGGVGKTALALEVAYQLADDPDVPYDCILWSSLKSERLTAAGVATIADSISDIAGATRQFGTVLDHSFDGSTRDLAENLDGLQTLIVIDNLESVNGDEVLRLYDAMPACVNFLFTSRIGIGEVERRHRLGPLTAKSATVLLRKFARARAASTLANLSQSSAESVVEQLRWSPLAIKWFVLCVEAGVDPLATIRDQRELLAFCVENVVARLSPEALDLLTVVRVLDRAASLDELAILADLEIDALRQGAQELSRGSLITYESDLNGGLAAKIGPSLAVKSYLPRDSMSEPRLAALLEREADFRRNAERRRENESTRSLAPWSVHVRSEEDEPAAYLLHKALNCSKAKRFADAQALVDKARAINPEYYEVYRVDAFIASAAKQTTRAVDLYRSALERANDPHSRAVVAHFFAGHLAREIHDVPLAIDYETTADEYFKLPDTAIALGTFLVWNKNFEDGQSCLERALDSATGMTRLIAVTAMVDSWRRWSEALLSDHHYARAFEHSKAGFWLGDREIGGVSDLRLAGSICEALVAAMRAISGPGADARPHIASLALMVDEALKKRRLLELSGNWVHVVRAGGQVARASGVPADFRDKLLTLSKERSDELDSDEGVDLPLVGVVHSWIKNYGFIKHHSFPENVFFHEDDVVEAAGGIEPGFVVEFVINREVERLRASNVAVRQILEDR